MSMGLLMCGGPELMSKGLLMCGGQNIGLGIDVCGARG